MFVFGATDGKVFCSEIFYKAVTGFCFCVQLRHGALWARQLDKAGKGDGQLPRRRGTQRRRDHETQGASGVH